MNIWETNAGHTFISVAEMKLLHKKKQISLIFHPNQMEEFSETLNEYLEKGYLVVHTIPGDGSSIVILEKPD